MRYLAIIWMMFIGGATSTMLYTAVHASIAVMAVMNILAAGSGAILGSRIEIGDGR